MFGCGACGLGSSKSPAHTPGRATNTQAIIGCLLFHTLFVVAQDAGTVMFGDPVVGEYFRVFLCYGVIAIALVMYAWKGIKSVKRAQAAR